MFGQSSIRATLQLRSHTLRSSFTRAGVTLRVPHQLGFSAGYSLATSLPLDTEEHKHYYCLGVNVGRQLDNGTLNDLTPGDVEAICAGLADVLNEADMRVDVESHAQSAAEFFNAKQEAAAAEANKAQMEYLVAAAAEDSATQTDSGLVYKETRTGDGDSPSAADTVEVHYEGRLIDGTVFDSSYARGETVSFPLGGVIGGWTEGLQLMKPGGKATLTIPAELAYGERGSPPKIPGGATLQFDVELIKVH